jgi:hypothetical protein
MVHMKYGLEYHTVKQAYEYLRLTRTGLRADFGTNRTPAVNIFAPSHGADHLWCSFAP